MLIDTTSPPSAPAPAMQRARGVGRIIAKARDGITAIDRLYQDGCAKIRLPKTHGSSLSAVLINSSGGLTDGDTMDWTATAGPGTHLVVTTQACERIYRAAAPRPARVDVTLSVAAGARLDWLPQETILFEGAALARTLSVEMAPDATLLALEAVILGRQAMGEDALNAGMTDRWRIRRDGVLIHAEQTALEPGAEALRRNPALLAGASAFATLCYVSADAERRHAELVTLLADMPDCGVDRIGDKVVVRAIAGSGYRLRRVLMPVVAALSPQGSVPRLWSL